MFHANAWCFPFSCTMTGVKQVFPGPHMDPASLLDALAEQKVTVTAGVPTIWMGILQALDATPDAWDLSAIRFMTVGGAAPPRAMIEAFGERHGLHIVHGWGMTEMSPVGTLSGAPGQEAGLAPQDAYTRRAKQGVAIPFVEIRASSENGLVPWDGETMGELEVRGPSISSAYFESEEGADRWTEDGWFKTGDVVTIHPDGFVEVQDRAKDLVKSGGEWISTVALENALMGHPAVAEAAVIAVPDEKWSERPLAVVVLREGEEASPDELREFLAPNFAKWWLPDRFEFVDEIPKTAVGKFRKTALREQFAQQPAETALRYGASDASVSTGSCDGLGRASSRSTSPAGQRALGAAPRGARGRDRPARRRRRRARDRARRSGRARVRRRRGHHGVPSLREAAAEAHERGSARGIQKLGHRMDAARTPFVAAIHGFCLGGGLELAMCCDIRVASDDAQLGQPEIKLGLIPGGGGTQRLPRLVGIGRAQYLNMTGDFIDAATAYDWGLVEKVVPREELRETALGIARTIAARSPVSVGILRELARTTRDLPLEEGLRREADGFRRCLESEDGAEGVAAFLEKREPQFTGR